MTFSDYSSFNTLANVSFIAGTEYTFTFNMYDTLGALVDLSSSTLEWSMADLRYPNVSVLDKTGNLLTAYSFSVVLDTADTLGLAGKYIHQPIITDEYGYTYRPSQGIITIGTGIT